MESIEFKKKYDRVKGFFENEVSNYLVADLKRLGAIQDHPCCTVPESLAVFSFLDLLGFLMRPYDHKKESTFDAERRVDWPKVLELQEKGENIDDNDKRAIDNLCKEASKTKSNLKYVFSEWLSKFNSQYDNPLHVELIIILFRHGGAHQFLPKIGEIAKGGKSTKMLRIEAVPGKYPLSKFNQDIFRENFLNFIKQLIDMIVKYKDSEFKQDTGESLEQMISRISDRLDARLFLDRKQLLEILKNEAPNLVPYSNETYIVQENQDISFTVDPKDIQGSGIEGPK